MRLGWLDLRDNRKDVDPPSADFLPRYGSPWVIRDASWTQESGKSNKLWGRKVRSRRSVNLQRMGTGLILEGWLLREWYWQTIEIMGGKLATTRVQCPHCYRRPGKIHGEAWETGACKLKRQRADVHCQCPFPMKGKTNVESPEVPRWWWIVAQCDQSS